MPVRHMHRHHAVRAELLEVHRHGFAREQMDGDRVGGEGIDDDEVVGTVGRFGEREPRITENDRHVRATHPQKTEQIRVARNADDGGVDLVIVHGIIRRGAASQRACAKAYHCKADRPVEARAHRREGLRDGGTIPVVKQQFRRIDRRQPTVGFADTLPAMERGPVL